MTTPAPTQQQPPPVQPVPPPQDSDLDSPLFVTAVSAALLTVGPVATVIAALKVRFALSHAAWTALSAVLGEVLQHPPPVTGVIGPASEQTARQNLARRAQFVVSASKRVMADLVSWRAKRTGPGESPSEPVPGPASAQAADLNVLRGGQFGEARRGRLQADIDASENAGRMQALQDGLARERRYYSLHLAAMWNRATAAGKVDMAALEHGKILGWASVRDRRTSADCAAADHHNFHADRMPKIGWPSGVHNSCRCFPVPPWPGAPMLPLGTLF